MIKKRFASGMLVLTMVAGMLSGTAITVPAADGDIAIDATNFPDKNFRSYVSENLDEDSDGVLSKEEIESVTEITASKYNISDLTGVNTFYNLKSLYCFSNNLSNLDISNLTELTTLNCSKNKLISLDVSKNTKLTYLNCYTNNLTSLDVSTLSELENLYCGENNLSNLDLSKNENLLSLICYDNVRRVPLDENKQFDLSTLDGFNVKKASDWDGGTVSGTTLTFTENTVTYTYDTGYTIENGDDPIVFTLKKECKHANVVKKTKKASFDERGEVMMVCSDCGDTIEILSTTSGMMPPTLSKTSYIYDGKVKKPSVTLEDWDGNTLKKDTDYTVSYASGRKKVGSYKVTIKGKGNYTGSKTLTFKILPAATSISKLTAGSKAFTVKWSKKTTETTGYQIQYSLKKDFSNAKSVTVTKNSTTSKKISKLKASKKYYVRVRTYKKVSDKKYYSSWSKAKAVTTKK